MTPYIYQAPTIAGVRPLFVLPSEGNRDYFESHGGAPEWPLILWAETLMPRHGFFCDVGAHVGTWSIIMGLRGHRIAAFEAQPWLARLCTAGFALNGIGGMDLSPHALPAWCRAYGLSDHTDMNVPLSSPYADGGMGSIVVPYAQQGETPIQLEVEIETLDQQRFVSYGGSGRIDLLKIDVEGAELDVLRGGRNTIERDRPKILFECWADERGQRKEELFRYLREELRYKVEPTTWNEMYVADPL